MRPLQVVAAVALALSAATPVRAIDIDEAAAKAGVDSVDLLGALYTEGLEDPYHYLYTNGLLARPAPAPLPTPYFGLTGRLWRVADCESIHFRPDVVYGPTRGVQGEIGLFQLHPRGMLPVFYARGFTNPWDPYQQVAFATWAFAAGYASHWSCK